MKNLQQILLLIFLINTSLQAQDCGISSVINTGWDQTYGEYVVDRLFSMLKTPDGGFLLAGHSDGDSSNYKSSHNRGMDDFWLVKTDYVGNRLWDVSIGGHNQDYLTSMIQTKDGNYLLGGYSRSDIKYEKSEKNRGLDDYWIVKVDPYGGVIWDKTFGGSHIDILTSMIETENGSFVLGGYSLSGISGDKSEGNQGFETDWTWMTPDYWVLKVDADGKKIWDKTIGGGESDLLNSIVLTPEGDYLLGGYSNSNAGTFKKENSKGGVDYWVVKLDPNGIIIWDKTIGGESSDMLMNITMTTDQNYVLGGTSNSDISGDKSEGLRGTPDYIYNTDNDFWLVKIDSEGTILWDKTLGGTSLEYFGALIPTQDNGVVAAGSSYSNIGAEKSENRIGGYNDYWIIRTDENGEKIWDKTLGGTNVETLTDIIPTSEGYLIGGHSDSNRGADKSDNRHGQTDYHLRGNDFWVISIKVTEEVKPCRPTSKTDITETTKSSLHIRAYPNPTDDLFTIELDNLNVKPKTITLYDIKGNLLKNLPFTSVKTDLSLANLSPGWYVLKITTEEGRVQEIKFQKN
ncbi:MAG: T9SS type A sorting domain-containing protein [Microscillaceae bacterium]|nr:T9SS type A sorting domain-containing protein [Microscillaceae bacterium]